MLGSPQATWITLGLLLTDLVIRIGLSVRVIMRRRPVGVTLAWLSVILVFPFVGAVVYLLFGELRLGRRAAHRAQAIHGPYQEWIAGYRERNPVDWSSLDGRAQATARLTEAAAGIPAVPGNRLLLLRGATAVFDSLLRDLRAARQSCHLEFYIWSSGGRSDTVAEALIESVARGVPCRVILDAAGSHEFLRGAMADRMRHAGVQIVEALPVSLFRALFVRFDLRLHRKIVVIDGRVGYTGSFNLADPRDFKKDAHVGQWVDAMVRVEGPAVEALALTFLEDWELEAGESLPRRVYAPPQARGADPANAVVQVAPSGPLVLTERIQAVLLAAIYSARRELVLTTPYFVPDEELVTALASAAARGVEVTLVLPARNDSRLVELASQPFQGDLIASGVRVLLFEGGLLHTKSITVDGTLSLFGSLNLDPRSFFLNFEITLAVYDAPFTRSLRALQGSYMDQSRARTLQEYEAHSSLERFAENSARLLGPLL